MSEKPYPEFPLFLHQNGQYCKKIGGRFVYFGRDWQAALRKYHAYLEAPSCTLRAAIDRYLLALQRLQDTGEVTKRHYGSVKWTLDKLAGIITPTRALAGLTSEDFGKWRATIGKTNGPVSLGNHVRRVRAFLNWCVREKIISALPAGDALKKPSRNQLRRARAAQGSRMFTPKELRLLLVCATPTMRAMILLSLNCGLGNEELGQLRTHHINGAWLNYPRPKTGIERRVPLWPETREALAAVIRPNDDVVFRTKYGNPWTPKGKMGVDSPISPAFTKLCRGANVYKPKRGFYSLRHVAQTVMEESGDHAATESILGHAPMGDDMSAVYRERMSSKRLFRTVKYMRRWLGLKKGVKILLANGQATGN